MSAEKRSGRGLLIWMAVLLFVTAGAAVAVAQENDGQIPEAADAAGCGLLVYDWSGPVTTSDRGFPREQPPRNNFDWTQPVNYAAGTMHFRAEIISQPVPQDDMRLQLCIWQPKTADADYKFGLETCGSQRNVPGNKGTIVEWSQDIDDMFQLGGVPLDWDRPRFRAAVAIKNGDRLPVSNYNNWNWNGENASHWYPLNMNFTGRVTPPGTEFAGWDACLVPTAVNLQTFAGGRWTSAALPALLALFTLAGLSLLVLRTRRRGES